MAFWRARLSAASKSTGGGSLLRASFGPSCWRPHFSRQSGDVRGARPAILQTTTTSFACAQTAVRCAPWLAQSLPSCSRRKSEDAMRAVIVTLLPPPDPAKDRHGIFRRLGMFLKGVNRVCEEIEIVHFARPEETARAARLSAESSAYWGMPVTVRLAPLNLKARRWWQAGSAALSLRHRGDFRAFLGSDQM